MIGHQPAPIRLVDTDAPSGQIVLGDVDIVSAAAPPERDDGRMLDEQEEVRQAFLVALGGEASLECERLAVLDAPEVGQPDLVPSSRSRLIP